MARTAVKEALKTSSQNKPICCFVFGLGVLKGEGILRQHVPRKEKLNPMESSGAVGAKCPEFGV